MVQFGSHAATHAHTLAHPHPLCYAPTHVHPGRHYSHTLTHALTCAHAHALHSPRRSQVCISYVCSFLSAFLPAKKPQPMSRSTDLPPAISITPTTCAHTHTHPHIFFVSRTLFCHTHIFTHPHSHSQTHKLTHAHSHHHSHTKLHSHK